MKVTLTIGRLNMEPEFWWYCSLDGQPASYVFPVQEFPTPPDVLKLLRDGPGKWDFTSALHPAKLYRAPFSISR